MVKLNRDQIHKAKKRKIKRARRKLKANNSPLLLHQHILRASKSPSPESVSEEQNTQPEIEIEPSFAAVFSRFEQRGMPESPEYDSQGFPNLPEAPVLSNKQRKKQDRPSVFDLKCKTKYPENIEFVDTTSKDPDFLIYLKEYRNTIPVPSHWSHKKKFAEHSRKSDKMPFALPEFIEATGIAKIRSQMREKEAGRALKQRVRDRMNPKLGRIDIDYQVLHDAFFKHQTKPKMTSFGQVYHEGMENSIKMRVFRPGQLSDELKTALGMTEYSPPPWLIHMQRFGPPPSYPHLKIPGLNAPIPENGNYGEFYKPDEQDTNAEPVEHWGDLISEEEESEDDSNSEAEDLSAFIRTQALTGFQDLSPDVAPVQQSLETSGYDTPPHVEIRKNVN